MNLSYKTFFPICCLFIVCILIFFPKIFFSGHVFYAADNFNLMTPTRIFFASELRHGRFPLWNPYILSGTPFFADLGYALLHPSNLLFLLCAPFRALTYSILFDYAIAFFGMVYLLRILRISPFVATCGALVFTFSGSLATCTGNLSSLHTTVLAPWVIGTWISFFHSKTYKTFLISVAALSFQILAGHPQMTYYTILFCISYTIFIDSSLFVRKVLYIFALLGASFSLCAVQLIPFAELASLSARSKLGETYATSGSMNPFYIIRFILPKLFGIKPQGTDIISDGNIYGYVGVIPLFCFFALRTWNPLKKFFLIMLILSILISFGTNSPIYWVIYYLVPGFSKFRIPQQILLIYTLCISILSAYGIQGFIRGNYSPIFNKIVLACSAAAGVVGITTYIFRKQLSSFLFVTVSQVHSEKIFLKLVSPGKVVLEGVVDQVSQNILLFAVASFTFVLWLKIKNKSYFWQSIILVILFFDLLFIVPSTIHFLPEEAITKYLNLGKQTVSQMKDIDKIQDKIYVPIPSHRAVRQKQYGLANDFEEELWQAIILRPDVNMYYNVSSVDGYTAMVYARYQEYFDRTIYLPTGIYVPDENMLAKVGLAGGTYIIGINGVVRKNDKSLPRIYLINSKNELMHSLSIDSYVSNSIQVTSREHDQSSLVFLDVNYPGWRAYVDGNEKSIIPFNTVFKSVNVPSGHHTIQFVYSPLSVRIGLFISIGTFIILLFIFLGNNKYRGAKWWLNKIFKMKSKWSYRVK